MGSSSSKKKPKANEIEEIKHSNTEIKKVEVKRDEQKNVYNEGIPNPYPVFDQSQNQNNNFGQYHKGYSQPDINQDNYIPKKYPQDTVVKPTMIENQNLNQNQNQKIDDDNLVVKSMANSQNNDDLIIKRQLNGILNYYNKVKNSSNINTINTGIKNYEEILRGIQTKINCDFGLQQKIAQEYENMRSRLNNIRSIPFNEKQKISEMNYYQFALNEVQNSLFYKQILENNKEYFDI